MDQPAPSSPSLFGRLTATISQFGNKHGFYLGRRLTKVHVAVYRHSGGRLAGHLPGWPEARIVLVDHVGARTGKARTSPLMYHADGDSIVVAATKGGQPDKPGLVPQPDGAPGDDDPDRRREARGTGEGGDRRGAGAPLARVRRLLSGLRILQSQCGGSGDTDRDPRAAIGPGRAPEHTSRSPIAAARVATLRSGPKLRLRSCKWSFPLAVVPIAVALIVPASSSAVFTSSQGGEPPVTNTPTNSFFFDWNSNGANVRYCITVYRNSSSFERGCIPSPTTYYTAGRAAPSPRPRTRCPTERSSRPIRAKTSTKSASIPARPNSATRAP